MSSFPRLRKLKLKRRLLRNQTRQSTAIRVRIMPSLGIMGPTTMPPRQRSPTGGQATFYINHCGDLRSREKQFASEPKSVIVTSKQSRAEQCHGCSYPPSPVKWGLSE